MKNDETVTMFVLAFFAFLAFIFIMALFAVQTVEQVEPQQVEQERVEPVQCEHEFVITSKYNWWLQSYKTISKCTKCGEEI